MRPSASTRGWSPHMRVEAMRTWAWASTTRRADNYNEAIRIDPKTWEAYYGRAKIHTLLGRGGEAEKDLDRAVELAVIRTGLDPGSAPELRKVWSKELEELKRVR